MPFTPDSRFDLPAESDALHALAELIGTEMAEGLWDVSARTLGISRPVRSPAELRRMADHLMNAGELARVAARSLKVRVITHDALSRTVAS